MPAMPSTLRIECGPDGPVNEYRLHHGRLELRVLWPLHSLRGRWRPLSLAEIIMHVNLETEVSRWMLHLLRQQSAAQFAHRRAA